MGSAPVILSKAKDLTNRSDQQPAPSAILPNKSIESGFAASCREPQARRSESVRWRTGSLRSPLKNCAIAQFVNLCKCLAR